MPVYLLGYLHLGLGLSLVQPHINAQAFDQTVIYTLYQALK